MKDIPAFPKTPFIEVGTPQNGMTLRDYFAAKAMQAIMGDRKEQNYWAEDYSIDEMMQFTAERAYEQADAMLKAREA